MEGTNCETAKGQHLTGIGVNICARCRIT